MKHHSVSIVIPIHNEQETIGNVLRGALEAVQLMQERGEVIVVNDRSTDRTKDVVAELSAGSNVVLIDSKYGPGKGGALRSGFDIAQGECLVMMDGDGSHLASDIPSIVDAQRKRGGLVVASRIYGGSEECSRIRATGNLFLTWAFGMLHGRYLSDALNGFKAFDSQVYRSFRYSSNGYEIEIELLVNTLRLGLPITEIPSLELRRLGGEVKSRIVKDGFKFLWRIIYEKYFRQVERLQAIQTDAVLQK